MGGGSLPIKMYICMNIYIYIYMYVCYMCMYIYIYTHVDRRILMQSVWELNGAMYARSIGSL